MVEWDVSLGATIPDAWPEFSGKIAASERDSSAPKDGEAWVAVPIELTRTAEGSDTIYAVVWRFIAKSGVDYVDPCSYSLPDFVKSSTEVASGETISSKACVLVPEDEIEGGTWRVAIINSNYEKVAEAYFAMN